jgi:diacylglycerol kinase family enzyme
MKIAVVFNISAGSLLGAPLDRTAQAVRAPFERAGAAVTVTAAPGVDFPHAVNRAAADADVVVVGGGDGTILTAAGILLPLGKALGVLPLGTMNLLARDLGLPADVEGAAAALAAGRLRTIDVGEVNGALFLNSSVLGGFARMVRAREDSRRLWGPLRWAALASAGAKSLLSPTVLDVHIRPSGTQAGFDCSTPLLVVATAPFRDGVGLTPQRESLTGGRLGVYVTRRPGTSGLLSSVWRLLRGRWAADDDMDALAPQSLTVLCRRRTLKVANDGEIVKLKTPLEYSLRPLALTVLAPRTDA